MDAAVRQFYSYLWLRVDGTPYYAGKGYGRRAFIGAYHNVRAPKDSSRILVFPMINEAEAFESEVALIDLFGRKDLGTGCLRNLTSGGEGCSGRKCTEEHKQRLRELLTGRIVSQITRDKLRVSGLGHRDSEETRQKKSLARTGSKNPFFGKHHSDDTKLKLRTASLGKMHSEETKQRMQMAHRDQKREESSGRFIS